MKSREIIEMIESGTAPMEKVPPQLLTLDCETVGHIN